MAEVSQYPRQSQREGPKLSPFAVCTEIPIPRYEKSQQHLSPRGTERLASLWRAPLLHQLSHVVRELSLPFPCCTYLLGTKRQNREKRDPTASARQEGESCSLKPGRSEGVCSFILSRRGAAGFPPVPLKHNSWISVSEAVSLLSV